MATSITVVCPHCSKKMRASTDHVGRMGRCPECKALVEISLPGGGDSPSAVRPREDARNPPTRAAVGTTDVPTWMGGLIGLGTTALLYLGVFLPFQDRYLGELFVKRGITPYFSVLVLCWGLAHLTLKYLAVKRQQSYADLELELIPLDIGLQITPANVDQFLGHLAKLPPAQRRSVLGRRIQGALEHFKGRNSVPEVQEFLATQAEIDASGVDSGYTLLRTFIWISPILGFIGTVIGISQAVEGLKDALDRPAVAAPADAQASTSPAAVPDTATGLMKGMQRVTSGLATAFDTTLVALIFAIWLVFPTESLRKSEYAMLDRIETFTIESLIRRMSDERPAFSQEELPEVVRDALNAAFTEHQKWLAQWQAQVGELGGIIGADFEQLVSRIEKQIAEAEAARLGKMQDASRMLSEMFNQFGDATRTWHNLENDSAGKGTELMAAARQIEGALAQTAQVGRELLEGQQRQWQGYAASDLGANLLALQREIGRLADQLDAHKPPNGSVVDSVVDIDPITMDRVVAKGEAKRGWFGRSRGRT